MQSLQRPDRGTDDVRFRHTSMRGLRAPGRPWHRVRRAHRSGLCVIAGSVFPLCFHLPVPSRPVPSHVHGLQYGALTTMLSPVPSPIRYPSSV